MRTLLSDAESTFRVLIVDDQPAMAGTTALLVGVLGYEAIQSHSPYNALERIKTESIDLLLSDYEMPGMNGLELASQLRKEGYDLPIILMSGRIKAIDLKQAERLSISMILEKPFGMTAIRAAFKVILK